jgi:hypothetical protein
LAPLGTGLGKAAALGEGHHLVVEFVGGVEDAFNVPILFGIGDGFGRY